MFFWLLPLFCYAQHTLTFDDIEEFDKDCGVIKRIKKNFEYADIVIPAEIDGYVVKAIGKNAFLWHKLKSVAIENGIDSIAKNAFWDCGIDDITLPKTLRYIGNEAFCKNNISKLILPPNVSYIGHDAFGEGGVTELIFEGEALDTIHQQAFNGCEIKGTLVIPNGIKHLGERCFTGVNVETIIFPASLLVIDGFPCSKIKHLKIPSTAKSIKEEAFFDCDIETIEIENGVEYIGNDAFFYGGLDFILKSLNIPPSVKKIGSRAFAWHYNLKELTLSKGLENIGSACFSLCNIEKLTIPSTVEIIGDYAFEDNEHLTELTLKDGLQEIGKGAFKNCAITNIYIPSTVRDLREEAFYGNKGVQTITIGDGVPYIGERCFYQIGEFQSLILPPSVIDIRPNAFYGSGAPKMQLPQCRNKGEAKFVGWRLYDDIPNNCGDEVSVLSYKYWDKGYIAIFEEQSTAVVDIEQEDDVIVYDIVGHIVYCGKRNQMNLHHGIYIVQTSCGITHKVIVR